MCYVDSNFIIQTVQWFIYSRYGKSTGGYCLWVVDGFRFRFVWKAIGAFLVKRRMT